MTRTQIICNSMSELKQFEKFGKDMDKDMVINHIQYVFQLFDEKDAEQVYNHMLALG